MISIDIKTLWALEEDSDLIIHQEEEEKIITHIQDKFIKNNQIKYQLEDITDYNNTSTEEDNKTIITYSLNNNDNIKKIMEIQEKDAAQKINKYIRQYFSDTEGHNKIKEEEYNVNKNIVRLDKIENNITSRYRWRYLLLQPQIMKPIPTVYSLITTTHQGNIKKEIEKSRALKNENETIKINWKHMDNFNKVIQTNHDTKIIISRSRHYKENNKEINWNHYSTYDETIYKTEPNIEIIEKRSFQKENYREEERHKKIDWLNANTYNKKINCNNDAKTIQTRHFKDSKYSNGKQKINWSHNMTCDTITYTNKDNSKINYFKYRYFKDLKDSNGEQKIDWSNKMTYDKTIDESQNNKKITQIRRFKDGPYTEDNKEIDWSNDKTYDETIQNISDKTKYHIFRKFKNEKDSKGNPIIDWKHKDTYDKIIDKTEPNIEITQIRRFKDGPYTEDNKEIDWINFLTYNETIDNSEINRKRITKSSRHFKDDMDQTGNPIIDWLHAKTYDEIIDESQNNKKMTQIRRFKDGPYTEDNKEIDWLHKATYDDIYDKTTGNHQRIYKKDFKKLFENISKINLEPQYLGNNQKVKEVLKNKLATHNDDIENILKDITIQKDGNYKVKLSVQPDSNIIVNPCDIVLESTYAPSINHYNDINYITENATNTNKEKNSFSLWLIISSIMIIGVIGYLVYLYINSKRP